MGRWLVRDVMTRDVVSVNPDTPYGTIVDALTGRRVSAAPVVDADHRIVGVVSEADLLHNVEFLGVAQPRPIMQQHLHEPRNGNRRAAVAADLMTTPAVTVGPGTPVAAVVKRMEAARVKRLPAVDEQGRLVGTVSRRDLLSMHLRPDPAIRDEIVDVLQHTLHIDPLVVQVDVADGTVTLTGTVEQDSTADRIVRLASDVAGVVRSDQRLAWRHDEHDPNRRP